MRKRKLTLLSVASGFGVNLVKLIPNLKITEIPPKPKNDQNIQKTYKMTERHGFKNWTGGKTVFASNSCFLAGFGHFCRTKLVLGSWSNRLVQFSF